MSSSQLARLGDQCFGYYFYHGPGGHRERHGARADDELLRAGAGEGGELLQTRLRSPRQRLPPVVLKTLPVQRPARRPSLERAKPSRQVLLIFPNQRIQPDGEPDRHRVPALGFRHLPELAGPFGEGIHASLPYCVPAGSMTGDQPKQSIPSLSPNPDRRPARLGRRRMVVGIVDLEPLSVVRERPFGEKARDHLDGILQHREPVTYGGELVPEGAELRR